MTFENQIESSVELGKGNVVLPFIQAAVHISAELIKIIRTVLKCFL